MPPRPPGSESHRALLALLALLVARALPAADPFTELWRREIGRGYAPPVVGGDGTVLALGLGATGGAEEDHDVLWCIAAADGTVRWRRALPVAPAAGRVARYPGPRAAPAPVGDAVLVLSHDGRLRCCALDDGTLRWAVELRDWGGAAPSWGYAGRPLVVGDRGWVHVGGAEGRTVAFALADGRPLWSVAVGGAASHTDPLRWGDALVLVTADEVLAQDLDDGTVRWRHEWRTRGGNNSPPPLPIGEGLLLLSSAYRGDGAAASRLLGIAADESTRVVWEHDDLVMHTTQALLVDGHLFGAAGRIDRDAGGIVCIEALSGRRRWLHPECNGTLVLDQRGSLLVLTLDGQLIQCAADPSAWRELARQRLFAEDRSYGPVVPVAEDGILVRTEAGHLIALQRSDP